MRSQGRSNRIWAGPSELLVRYLQSWLLLLADLRRLHRTAAGVSPDRELLGQGAQAAKTPSCCPSPSAATPRPFDRRQRLARLGMRMGVVSVMAAAGMVLAGQAAQATTTVPESPGTQANGDGEGLPLDLMRLADGNSGATCVVALAFAVEPPALSPDDVSLPLP